MIFQATLGSAAAGFELQQQAFLKAERSDASWIERLNRLQCSSYIRETESFGDRNLFERSG